MASKRDWVKDQRAAEIGQRWANEVRELCRQAQIELSRNDSSDGYEWRAIGVANWAAAWLLAAIVRRLDGPMPDLVELFKPDGLPDPQKWTVAEPSDKFAEDLDRVINATHSHVWGSVALDESRRLAHEIVTRYAKQHECTMLEVADELGQPVLSRLAAGNLIFELQSRVNYRFYRASTELVAEWLNRVSPTTRRMALSDLREQRVARQALSVSAVVAKIAKECGVKLGETKAINDAVRPKR